MLVVCCLFPAIKINKTLIKIVHAKKSKMSNFGTSGQVSPIIRKLINFFARREVKLNNRLPADLNFTSKTPPPPSLPPGASDKLSSNYYYTRDGRRTQELPTMVYLANQKAITAGQQEMKAMPAVPGPGFDFGKGEGKYPQK